MSINFFVRHADRAMETKNKKILLRVWKIVNALLAAFFLYLIVDAWLQILYFGNAEKHYYYVATLFVIPFVTCLIVVLGWNVDES